MKNKHYFILLAFLFILVVVLFFLYFYIHNQKGNEEAAIQLYDQLIQATVTNTDEVKNSDFLSISINPMIDPLNNKELSQETIDKIYNNFAQYHTTIHKKSATQLQTDGTLNDTSNGFIIDIQFEITKGKTIATIKYQYNTQVWKVQNYSLQYLKDSWDITPTKSIQ